jgi:hypothetical protein
MVQTLVLFLKKIAGLLHPPPGDSPPGRGEIANQEAIDIFFKSLEGTSPKFKAERAAEKFRNSLKCTLSGLADWTDQFYPLILNDLMDRGLLENSDQNGWELPLACREEGAKKFLKEDWPKLSKKLKFFYTAEKAIEDVVKTDFPLTVQAQEAFSAAPEGDRAAHRN